jgi:hypothetical protein
MRWRLIGAWRWPLFFACTVADAFIAHSLPPTGRPTLFLAALLISSFANLFLVGAVAPWLARRIAARQGPPPAASFPPTNHFEVQVDKIAAVALVIATLGLVAVGLAHHGQALDVDQAHKDARLAAEAFVTAHAPKEIQRNFTLSNTYETQESGLFRICTPYDDRRMAWCVYVDVKRSPPSVRHDGDSRPNGVLFPGSTGEGF